MEIVFNDSELASLYENQKVKNKVYVSNPQLVKQYIKAINLLRAANRIEQLQQFKTLNYHKLSGDRAGQSTVYVNKQYRLIFLEVASNEPPHEITILEIEELSKHYD